MRLIRLCPTERFLIRGIPWVSTHTRRLLERSTTLLTKQTYTPRRTYESTYNRTPSASRNYNIMSSIILNTKVSAHKPLGIFSRVPRRFFFACPRRSKPPHGDLNTPRSISTVQVTPADCAVTGFPEQPDENQNHGGQTPLGAATRGRVIDD